MTRVSESDSRKKYDDSDLKSLTAYDHPEIVADRHTTILVRFCAIRQYHMFSRKNVLFYLYCKDFITEIKIAKNSKKMSKFFGYGIIRNVLH